MIDGTEMLIRLLLGSLLGAVIGFERERQNQPAGLRTHTILAVGATLAMILSINIALQFRPGIPAGDPGRLAAQVVSGIGFLGAGAILRFGNNIRGLTTATSLWSLAIVGLTVGAGHYAAAIATTVILLFVLTLLDEIEKRFIKTYNTISVVLTIDDRPGLLEEVRSAVNQQNTSIIQTSISRDFQTEQATFSLVVKTLAEAPVDEMVSDLSSLKGIKSFKIN